MTKTTWKRVDLGVWFQRDTCPSWWGVMTYMARRRRSWTTGTEHPGSAKSGRKPFTSHRLLHWLVFAVIVDVDLTQARILNWENTSIRLIGSLWGTFLIDHWYGPSSLRRYPLWAGSPGGIMKQAVQILDSRPLSIFYPWPLFLFLLQAPALLEFLAWLP